MSSEYLSGMEQELARLAKVPEHSVPLMKAVSGGAPVRQGDYLFFRTEDALLGVGYPLSGSYDEADFMRSLDAACQETRLNEAFAIAPSAPAGAEILEEDRYYVLSAGAPVPRRLRSPVRCARETLSIDESSEFTAGHRRLWSEFLDLQQERMNSRVQSLYVSVPRAISESAATLKLLNARTADGELVASLLLDYGPDNFVSYILGAHSRQHYVPHAMDLLFAEMLARGARARKRFVHLGLGVNPGILRFKQKWGAIPSRPFVMFRHVRAEESIGHLLATAMLGSGAKVKLPERPATKPFAMLWQVSKGAAVSWLGGTAHFFSHSFEPSLRRLFAEVDNVIFEGPLDQDFMTAAQKSGQQLPEGYIPLLDLLTEDEIRKLERMVYGPTGKIYRMLGMEAQRRFDVREVLATGLPWYAFFTLWTGFLERKGWHESVDMEAWRLAKSMGKNVIAMENLAEQMESLGSLPVERVLRFFRDCHTWPARARRNRSAYLNGDLERMMGSSAEFPTRTEHVVGRRDQRFRERMRPWLEKGRTAAFVGTAHLVNLRHMLREDGFTVRQAPYGLWARLHQRLRKLSRPDEHVSW